MCGLYRRLALIRPLTKMSQDLMDNPVTESLILDLLEWLAKRDRGYEQVMEAWRRSCPRLPLWEDANDRGLVVREQVQGNCIVRITLLGFALLERRQPRRPEVSAKDAR